MNSPDTQARLDLSKIDHRPLIRVLVWGILIWSGLAAWGRLTRIGPSTRAPFGFQDWDIYFDGLVTLTPILYLVLAPLIWFALRRVWQSTWWRSDRVLWALITLGGMLMTARYALAFDRFTVLSGLSMAALLALTILWLFDRETIPLRHTAVVTGWGMIVFALIDALPVSVMDPPIPPHDPLYTRLVLLALAIVSAGPALLILPVTRRIGINLYQRSKTIPAVWLAGAVMAVVVVQIGLWVAGLTFQPWYALTMITAVIPGTMLALRLIDAEPETESDAATGSGPWLLVIIALYVVLALIWMPRWKGFITPDGYVYLEVARRYSLGDFVVRGHWSPLISWLIAGPVALGASPEIAARTLLIGCGAASIWLIDRLAANLGFKTRIRLTAAAVMAVFALRHFFWVLGADQLAAALLMVYFVISTRRDRDGRPLRHGLLAGVLGALAYFAKAFSLPFVVAHLLLTGVLALRERRAWRPIATYTLAALVVTGGLIAPWVGQMQQRYDRVVILTRGYASARYGPNIENTFRQFCRLTICPHPDDTLFAWEDPEDEAIDANKWHTFDSLETFQFRMRLIGENMVMWWRETLTANLGILPLLAWLGLAIAALVLWRDVGQRRAYDWLVVTLLIYVGGYILVKGSEFRLHYPVVPLFILAVTLFADRAAIRLAGLGVSQRVTLLLIPALLATMVLRPSRHTPTPVWTGEAEKACTERDSLVIAPDLVAPAAGVYLDITALSYYSQVRSIGGFNTSIPIETIADLAPDYGIKSLVVGRSGQAERLEQDHGYTITAEHMLCGSSVWILYPPAP